MIKKVHIRIFSPTVVEMAGVLFLIMAVVTTCASNISEEVALANITRFAIGDLFSLSGSDCGPTRCMELSHGTALAAMGTEGDSCVCQCRRDMPAFREDHHVCTNNIDECSMAIFGRGATKPQIPFVYLPLKGQIIYPSKEIIFTDVEDAICAVTSAQYLSPSGWVTLRDLVDNDVPFGLYRDEGSTFLQWRGSAALHNRLEGRLVTVHVLCSASSSTRLAASCAAFRVAGTASNSLLDVRSIPFHAGEIMTTESASQNQGLSILESLAIGVCVLLLIFIYAAGIIFYVHYKHKQKRKQKDPEQNMSRSISTDNESSLDSHIDMSNMMLKANPLLGLDDIGNDFLNDASLSDVSERTEDTLNPSPQNLNRFQKLNTDVISAMVHSRRKKPTRSSIRSESTLERINERLQRRSASPDAFERAPHSDLSIVECTVENNFSVNRQLPSSTGNNNPRKKLYFNPVFLETEHLKDPPPAAVDFLVKIREVMSIAKEKMTAKRFIPILSDIPEEDLYQAIDLGWDISCARRGRRFSAITLKQENNRKSIHCEGCPGCDNNVQPHKTITLTRSSSCKTCVSEDYKQKIVRKWLDEVPIPVSNKIPVKFIAKVNGTPRIIESQRKEEANSASLNLLRDENTRPVVKETVFKEKIREQDIKAANKEIKIETQDQVEINVMKNLEMASKIKEDNNENMPKVIKPSSPKERKSPSSHTSRRVRKKLPPPPPPPKNLLGSSRTEDEETIPMDVKKKMEAVIRELNDSCLRVEPVALEEVTMETIVPIAPKIVIPVLAADSQYFIDDNRITNINEKETYVNSDSCMEFDSLERSVIKRRRFSVACGPDLSQMEEIGNTYNFLSTKGRLTSSWRDIKRTVDTTKLLENRVRSEVSINIAEPLYDNVNDISKPGSLTIQVRGSPVESRYDINKDEFDPDTLDRRDVKKRVDKILLKSAGSFKCKSTPSDSEPHKKSPDFTITRKIGSLREIYEAKAKQTKAQEEEIKYYSRRGSITYGQDMSKYMQSLKTPDLIRHIEGKKEPKPPIPPKQRRSGDFSPKFNNSFRKSPPDDYRRMSEERDRILQYTRAENLNARRSGRRSTRTRSRRTDMRKFYRTEDSGYMSTDSNESKRRARYLMHLKPQIKAILPEPDISIAALRSAVIKTSITQMESDTDDLESLCDGRSESGGESVETDSVFFGNFDDTKELFAELGLNTFELQTKVTPDQNDSGYIGETNIILSGDSDSEHRSVISIVTGRDGRTSSASVSKLDDAPYLHTIEC